MAKRAKKVPWSQTAVATEAYVGARAKAQADANRDGFDRGLEANDLFKQWTSFMLPARKNRYGHELRCEVVSCESLDRCQPGHGPR